MRSELPSRDRPRPDRRLRLSGLLTATGLLVALPTLFWTHPVSFFLFAGVSGLLVVTGMLVYLRSIMMRGGLAPPDLGESPERRPDRLGANCV